MIVVPLYTPKSESEAAVIASLLHAYGVSFFMRGGAFSTMYPGSMTSSLNEQTLMVRDDHVELAKGLLQSFLTDQEAI